MSVILHFETSGPYCSVAVGNNGMQLSLVEHDEVNTHAQQITLIMDQALEEAGVQLNDIEALAISAGPGSYTGLRVAASAAKGICYALKLPFIEINTLESLSSAVYQLDGDKDALYIPMIDARRMEVYTAIYTAQGEEVKAPYAKIVDESGYQHDVTFEGKKIIYSGSGVEKCIDLLDNEFSRLYPDIRCSASNLIPLAYEKFVKGSFTDMAYFKPFYLKSPNITKSKPML